MIAEGASASVYRAMHVVAEQHGLRPERDERLVRVRHGVYAEKASMEDVEREARYLQRIRAVHAVRSRPIFARESALAIHAIPYGLDPDAVYTTGDRRTAGSKAGIVHAQVELDPVDVVQVGDFIVCTLAYALAEVARKCAMLDAVSAIDRALHLGCVTKAGIVDALGRQPKRGRARAEWMVAFADGTSESVGESWSRLRVFQLGFAAPELQVEVAGPTGRQWRVDMRFARSGRRPVYGEFDGAVKYGPLANAQGKSGAQALAKEKARDDDLLFSGDPAHWIWADVVRPSRLERILAAYEIPRVRQPMLDMSRAA